MRMTKRLGNGVLCVLCAVLINGCGDSEKDQNADEQAGQTDVAEAERKLEEAQRLLEEAKAELEQAKEEQPYIPPPDHIEPFAKSFGFGNPDETAYFWSWAQKWEFTDAHAVSKQKPGGAVLASRYKLAGDFEIIVKGKLTQSWTNSKRSFFEVCGQQIGLANWRSTGIDLSIKRAGNQLTYTLGTKEPITVELTEEQAGPTQARLVAYGRFATIREFSLTADSADRIVE